MGSTSVLEGKHTIKLRDKDSVEKLYQQIRVFLHANSKYNTYAKPMKTAFLSIGFSIIALLTWPLQLGSRGLIVEFFDCGQGDCIYIELPNGTKGLIDTGPDPVRIRTLLSQALPPFDRHIDWLMISHFDKDHSSGLRELLTYFDIGTLYVGKNATSQLSSIERHLIQQKQVPIVELEGGKELSMGPQTILRILSPTGEHVPLSKNDQSIVAILESMGTSILFTGDLEEQGEQILLTKGVDLSATYLKVGHHGSTTSSARSFLRSVQPKTALIQAGIDNSFNHPHPDILQRLEEEQIQTYSTTTHGSIRLICTATCTIQTTYEYNP